MTEEGPLRTAPAADPDGIYQLLVDAHRDLDEAQSRLVAAKLTLLLANHIGDPTVVAAAIAAARAGISPPPADERG